MFPRPPAGWVDHRTRWTDSCIVHCDTDGNEAYLRQSLRDVPVSLLNRWQDSLASSSHFSSSPVFVTYNRINRTTLHPFMHYFNLPGIPPWDSLKSRTQCSYPNTVFTHYLAFVVVNSWRVHQCAQASYVHCRENITAHLHVMSHYINSYAQAQQND